MKNILFLAIFPTAQNIKDGMISRIKAVDLIFEESKRQYLEVRIDKYHRKEISIEDGVEVYRLNLLFHLHLIIKLVFNSGWIYSHSILRCTNIWLLLLFSKSKLVLDAHGVVPEEYKFFINTKTKHRLYFYYINFVERMVFLKADTVICVTEVMKQHFKKKYPNYKGRFIVYPIFPSTLRFGFERKKRQDGLINILYSGGLAPWQNIDLMFDVIKKNLSDKIGYTLLVTDKERVTEMFQRDGIDLASGNITVDSVMPEQLAEYYAAAEYAFILRDENVVNNVACPTKLIEYLAYGIIPIVLSKNIGDYANLGYEFLSVEDYSSGSLPHPDPSLKNMQIAKALYMANQQVNLKSIFSVQHDS